MVRKKNDTTAMDDLEKRFQEAEVRNKQHTDEAIQKAEEEIIAAIQGLTTATSGVNGGEIGGDGERKLRKVQLPIFKGEDAPEWLSKIECYYKVRKIDDVERMDVRR